MASRTTQHYRYIGTDPFLKGQEALGMWSAGYLMVQVDKLTHEWSHGWHLTCPRDWEVC